MTDSPHRAIAGPNTLVEMLRILGEGEVYRNLITRVADLENAYRHLRTVVRVSFDLPVLTWGASILVSPADSTKVHRHEVYGCFTAERAVNRAAKALESEFWKLDTSCPKCQGLGIECYADPEDRDYHMRPCDCPIGQKILTERQGVEASFTNPSEKP